jgi:ribonuclease HI
MKPEPLICEMLINHFENGFWCISIKHKGKTAEIKFSREKRESEFTSKGTLTEKLKKYDKQILKILNNKRENTFFEGFKLNFVLSDNFEVFTKSNSSEIIVYDYRNSAPEIYTKDNYENSFLTVYTDGSYSDKKKKSAYAFLYMNSKNLYQLKFGVLDLQSSSLAELEAVIAALSEFSTVTEIRIVTDSRYVIKGITEWIYNWKLNDWQTAQGEQVKNINRWKVFEQAVKGKYIEFQWVKAHSKHFENSVCDFYARKLLERC